MDLFCSFMKKITAMVSNLCVVVVVVLCCADAKKGQSGTTKPPCRRPFYQFILQLPFPSATNNIQHLHSETARAERTTIVNSIASSDDYHFHHASLLLVLLLICILEIVTVLMQEPRLLLTLRWRRPCRHHLMLPSFPRPPRLLQNLFPWHKQR
jgi:preprotein translocase subunit SecG